MVVVASAGRTVPGVRASGRRAVPEDPRETAERTSCGDAARCAVSRLASRRYRNYARGRNDRGGTVGERARPVATAERLRRTTLTFSQFGRAGHNIASLLGAPVSAVAAARLRSDKSGASLIASPSPCHTCSSGARCRGVSPSSSRCRPSRSYLHAPGTRRNTQQPGHVSPLSRVTAR